MLKVTDVHKSFGKNEILKGVNLTVEKGDVVVILGPSGSGKTTLLRTIDFLETADKGELEFDDIKTSLAHAHKNTILNVRRKTGFVYQNYNLFANKTALENVMEGLVTARRIPKEQAKEIAEKALAKVGMLDRKDFYPSQLSGGQQQRVGIARAIAPNPDVVLFDEPTSALDPELVGEVLGVIKELAKEGTTMIVVTHEIEFAQRVANRVMLIEDGLIVEENDANSFFLHPRQSRTIEFLRRTRWKPEGEILNDEGVI